MNNADFKKIVKNELTSAGFIYKNKNSYYSTEDLIAVIGLQKSNFSDGWYINFWFYVKAIHNDNNDYPKPQECDMFGRFANPNPTTPGAPFDLLLSQDEVEAAIKYDMDNKISPVIENGIEEYFRLFPTTVNGTKKKLKDYIGIEY